MKNKKFLTLIAGAMAVAMLVGCLFNAMPAKVEAATASELKPQL